MPRGPLNRDHTADLKRLLMAVWDTHLSAVQKAANSSQGEQGHRLGCRGRDISPPRFSHWDLSEPPRRRLRFSPSLDNIAPKAQHEKVAKLRTDDVADERPAAACTNTVSPQSVPLPSPPDQLFHNSIPSSSSELPLVVPRRKLRHLPRWPSFWRPPQLLWSKMAAFPRRTSKGAVASLPI